ncbi:MAG: hypothetical protein V1766_13315 [Pseudomonadota bacterium]
MSSPINIQQSVLQTVITERIQQVQQQHPDMQQRYFEHHLSQERTKKMHRVNDYEEMENIRFREKDEQRQRRDQRSHRNTETQDLDVEASINPDKTSYINIKV